jgi:hypothetical protein
MSEITPATVVVRSAGPLAAHIDDEVVMLDLRQGSYFGLDRAGSAIWDLLETPRPVGEVCAALVRRFDVTPEVCEADVVRFVEELRAAGLVDV